MGSGWKERIRKIFGWRFVKPLAPAAADYFDLLLAEKACILPLNSWRSEQFELYLRLGELEPAVRANLKAERPCSLVCVFEFEDLLIRLMPDMRIRSKAWSVRASYMSIVSKDLVQKYMETHPPDPRTGPIDAVRADVQDLTAGLHWWYVSAYRQEAALRRLKVELAYAVAAGFAVVLAMTVWVATNAGSQFVAALTPVEMMIYIMYAGVLGAITSTVRRIQPVAEEPIANSNPLLKSTALEQGNVGVLLSTALGGIFALVLAFALAAGMGDLIGQAAPRLGGAVTVVRCCNQPLYDFFQGLLPNSAIDFAKLLVWSFAAGFSERLVPDILDRVGAQKKT